MSDTSLGEGARVVPTIQFEAFGRCWRHEQSYLEAVAAGEYASPFKKLVYFWPVALLPFITGGIGARILIRASKQSTPILDFVLKKNERYAQFQSETISALISLQGRTIEELPWSALLESIFYLKPLTDVLLTRQGAIDSMRDLDMLDHNLRIDPEDYRNKGDVPRIMSLPWYVPYNFTVALSGKDQLRRCQQGRE